MFQQETEDIYLASTNMEILLAKHNVPRKYWKGALSSISFKAIKNRNKILIKAIKQRAAVRALMTEAKRGVSIISSIPTDEAALLLSSIIIQERIKQTGNDFLWLDAQNARHAWQRKKVPPLVIIYNILNGATPERLECVRDAIMRFRYSMCLIVVAGINNPIKFGENKLRLHIDNYILVKAK